MSNGHTCCLVGICCPPPQQVKAMKDAMVADGMDEATAQAAAECLAPKIRAAAKKLGLKFTAEAGE